jgi:AmmeMemoRadiSam system protein A
MMQISSEQQAILLDTARMVIRDRLRGRTPPPLAPNSDPFFLMPAGCFVSLYEQKTHRLRGCIGRLQSPDPLLQNIYQTAASVLGDPRFRSNPVTSEELPRLVLEISVLSPLKPAATPLDFDPQVHGIYLICHGRTGTFLPQVARQTGWSRQELLARLCTEKMDLPAESWEDPEAKLFIYEAAVIGPVPFIPEPVTLDSFGRATFIQY